MADKVILPVLELIGCNLPYVKPSKNRSKRQWKKLLRKGATPLYSRPKSLIVSKSLVDKIKEIGGKHGHAPSAHAG